MEEKEPWARLPRELLRVVARKHGDAFAREAAEAVAARFPNIRERWRHMPGAGCVLLVLACRSAPRASVASGVNTRSQLLGRMLIRKLDDGLLSSPCFYDAAAKPRWPPGSFAQNLAGKGAFRYTLVATRLDGTLIKGATAVHDSQDAVERMVDRFVQACV